jgi:uncharacterized protein YndB with AHSA1/START domain
MNAALAPASVVVRRTITASPEELFDAWLDPDALGSWMRPGSIRRTQAKVDARVGGRYEIFMQSDAADYPHSGEYRVIERPHRLAFTWQSRGTEGIETLVTVDFLPVGPRTEVVVTHERLPDTARESHANGWTSGIERLDQFISGRTPHG